MTYQDDPLRLCHEMTAQHMHFWHELLEEKADEIIFKSQHPVRYFFKKLAAKLKD